MGPSESRIAGLHHIWSYASQGAAFPENEMHEVTGARAGFPQQQPGAQKESR